MLEVERVGEVGLKMKSVLKLKGNLKGNPFLGVWLEGTDNDAKLAYEG